MSIAHFLLDGTNILANNREKYVFHACQNHMGACILSYSGLNTKAGHFPADLFISYMTYLETACTKEQCYLYPRKLKIMTF